MNKSKFNKCLKPVGFLLLLTFLQFFIDRMQLAYWYLWIKSNGAQSSGKSPVLLTVDKQCTGGPPGPRLGNTAGESCFSLYAI